MKAISFDIHSTFGRGRTGTILTAHGEIHTPAFVTVGTKATVKALTPEMVATAGAQVVLANTYHLYIDPDDEAVARLGGLHKMMNWSGPTMTDSGGFQVFSLGAAYGKGLSKILKKNEELVLPERGDDDGAPKIATIDPDGVTFRSHTDGAAHYFSPEKSIDIQHNLGADIIFAFDECTSPHEPRRYQEEALDRTHRWAKKSLARHVSKPNAARQALFGIVQGGRDEALRKESAAVIAGMEEGGQGFDGFGIGGSFEKEDMEKAVIWVNDILPEEKPRHLLGIGEPEDLFMAVENGCDLFDCVAPTRLGRNGTVYTRAGKTSLKNSEFRDDSRPIDPTCHCYACENYSRAYIAHLFRAKEMLAGTLASIHNLHFIIHLVDEMRQSLAEGDFMALKKDFLAGYKRK